VRVQLFVPLLTEEAMATMRANCQSNQDHWAALLEKHGKQTAGELVTGTDGEPGGVVCRV